MSDVASLELCAELYKLTDRKWKTPVNEWSFVPVQSESLDDFGKFEEIPQYSLGFLLRKLPYYIDTKDARGTFEFFLKKTSQLYHAGYNKPESGKWLVDDGSSKRYVWQVFEADTPEDAACRLCIELIKQGILPKESK